MALMVKINFEKAVKSSSLRGRRRFFHRAVVCIATGQRVRALAGALYTRTITDVTKFLIIRRENRQLRVGGISVAPI